MNYIRFRRDQGFEARTAPVTIQQMFDAYKDYSNEKGLAPGTLKGHTYNFKNHILKFYGAIDIASVTPEEHHNFVVSLTKKGVSPATRNRIRSFVRVMFTVAIKNKLFNGAFKSNPFDGINPAVEPKKSIEYLTPDQLEQLLEANRDNYYYPLILTLLRTGMRIGEALGIHENQINRTTGMLTIDRQFDKSQGKIVMRTKGKNIRVIYLIDEVLKILPKVEEGPIFRRPDGSPVPPDFFLKNILPKACKRAGVKEIHTHGLRHSFASHYLMNGGSIWDLSKILGHYSVSITEEFYAHFSLDHIRDRMRIIEKKAV